MVYLAPIGLSILINGSKGAIIVIILSALLCLYHSIKSLLVKFVFTLGIVTISLNIIPILRLIINKLYDYGFTNASYSLTGLYRALTINDFTLLLSGRGDIYANSILGIKGHPFGMGIAKFHELFAFYPHNIFLDIFVTFGVIIGSSFMLLLIYEFISGYKSIVGYPQLIIFIAVLGNFSRLFVSKTFISDPVFWLLVATSVAIKVQSENTILSKDNVGEFDTNLIRPRVNGRLDHI